VEIKRVVCMECGRVIRDMGLETGMVSHGLCTGCAADFARQIEALEVQEPTALEVAPLPALAVAR
jgi:hypothetical protein